MEMLSCKKSDSRHFPASRTSRSVPSRSHGVPSPSRTHVPVPGSRFTSCRTAGQLTGQIGDFEPIFGDCPVSRKYDFSGEIHLVRIITRTLEHDSITTPRKVRGWFSRKKYGFDHNGNLAVWGCPVTSLTCPVDTTARGCSGESKNVIFAMS